jgi:hypothetical protein
MRIGIDVSQIVYEGAGVARYVRNLVREIIRIDKQNEYILFGATLRKRNILNIFIRELHTINPKVRLVWLPLPPILLDLLWNRWHIIPAEWFTGPVDIFWSSDWTQPPLQKAKGMTTVFDLIYLKFPLETNPKTSFNISGLRLSPNIVAVQSRRMKWVKKECQRIICDSISTKKDLVKLLATDPDKITVIYPGI